MDGCASRGDASFDHSTAYSGVLCSKGVYCHIGEGCVHTRAYFDYVNSSRGRFGEVSEALSERVVPDSVSGHGAIGIRIEVCGILVCVAWFTVHRYAYSGLVFDKVVPQSLSGRGVFAGWLLTGEPEV